jgi:acetyl-CoA acetyltransferase
MTERISHPMQDRAAVVGIAQTRFAKNLAPTEEELAIEAVLAALDDAGIEANEVDALSSFTMENLEEVALAKDLGFGNLSFFSQVGYGGGGACGTIAHLAMAIATGQANVGVAWRSRKRGSGGRPWASGMGGLRIPGSEQVTAATWARPWGLSRPADEIAMLARRYLHDSGADREAFAAVAMAAREHANLNPDAVMYERKLSLDDYLASRMISEPLCLFDNCLESDGAVAVVLTSAERARDCRRQPVYVHAGSQGLPRQHHHMVNYWCDDPVGAPGRAAAEALWRQSELRPEDIDVVELYDAFTPLVLFSLEGYGFCGRNEAAEFVKGGTLGPGGALPFNTAGGGLSEGYIHGMNLVAEGVRQMRGDSTGQVPDAKACLVTSGDCVPTSAVVLRAA